MEKEKCMLCGQAAAAGLHVLGCLICFPCEKRLVHGIVTQRMVKNLHSLHASMGLEG